MDLAIYHQNDDIYDLYSLYGKEGVVKITSRASDYALLLLLYLAQLAKDETASVKKIASYHKLSIRFLANIANRLAVSRIIIAHRGVGGGLKLAKPSHEISLREVIEAVDGPIQTMFCQNTHEICCHEFLCQMKKFWDGLQGDVISKLNKTTIGDLAHVPTPGAGGLSRKMESMAEGIMV